MAVSPIQSNIIWIFIFFVYEKLTLMNKTVITHRFVYKWSAVQWKEIVQISLWKSESEGAFRAWKHNSLKKNVECLWGERLPHKNARL